jgi:hypothetical protein
MESNRTYFMRRATQEREAALRSNGKAREAHELMAKHYAELASEQSAPAAVVPAA